MQELLNEIAFPLLMSTVAGLSTLLGAIFIFFTNSENRKILSLTLGFSAGVMIYISFMEILPSALLQLGEGDTFLEPEILMIIGFFLGLIIFSIIDALVPEKNNPHNSKTIEDVDEIREEVREDEQKNFENENLKRVGLLTAFGMILHNFPEGLATFLSTAVNTTFGVSIAIAVALHNIPEGISVAIPIYQGTNSKREAIKYTFICGIAEPLGGLIGYLLLRPVINSTSYGIILASVAGIMVGISLDELIPTSKEYSEGHLSFYGIISGMIVMALTMVFLGE